MSEHQFIFSPGIWLGQGVITFSYSEEKISYYTKWIVEHGDDGTIHAQQQVQKQGEKETLLNFLVFSPATPQHFSVELKNEEIECVQGKGMRDDKQILWTYYTNISSPQIETFEGFESYLLQSNGEYNSHAEYTSIGEYTTIVDGKIWKKE
jgi:hypothetical protein